MRKGFIKGKSTIYVAGAFGGKRNFMDRNFLAGGCYCVSTVDYDTGTHKEPRGTE